VAIGVTLVASLIGAYEMCTNHRSYSFKFSTIMRMTRIDGIDELVEAQDRDGRDTLRDRIKQAKLTLCSRNGSVQLRDGTTLDGQRIHQQQSNANLAADAAPPGLQQGQNYEMIEWHPRHREPPF
jgi:hypothetical protein